MTVADKNQETNTICKWASDTKLHECSSKFRCQGFAHGRIAVEKRLQNITLIKAVSDQFVDNAETGMV